MTPSFSRRRLMQLPLLAAVPNLMLSLSPGGALAASRGSDFDFFIGDWRVSHRRLKKRLANSDDWEEFEGTSRCQSLLGGLVNLNESAADRPGGATRGMGIRAFDASKNQWTDWYFSDRNPTQIAVEGTGTFANGVGTFLSDDTFEGKPIKVRGLWSGVTANSFQWEQAFSVDAGKSWETNWIMHHVRKR